jgi:tRNA dimethylallyltransferase
MSRRPSLIIISGPTSVGKTRAAISLAEPLAAEIISADAMQVYRYMDIGTAKPKAEETARVPHHLIDVVDPDEAFSAAEFRTMAEGVITDLHENARPAFVVGGTGLYIKALTRGLFMAEEHDAGVRERLRQEVETLGLGVLHERLEKVDPEGAARIHPNDTYRIIRALEIFELTGKPLSSHHRNHGFSHNPYRVLKIGLSMAREILYDRINRRVEQMIASGLVEEVKWLLDHGYSPELKSMRSIGYLHMTDYLQGRTPWDETIEMLKRDTRRYAKRQLTWFRADPEIEWLQPSEIGDMRRRIDAFLEGAA